MSEYVIYKISMPFTSKVYIGKTDRYEEKVREHIAKALSFRPGKLYDAMRKYGVKNFSFERLATCRDRLESDLYESKYIKEYDSYNNGYNPDPGCNEDDQAYFRILGRDFDDVAAMMKGMQLGKYRLADFDKPVRDIIYMISESETVQRLINIAVMMESRLNEVYFAIYDKDKIDAEKERFYSAL